MLARRFCGVMAWGVCLLVAGCAMNSGGPESLPRVRVTQSFDADWHFTRGDPADAQAAGFDDAHWRRLDVPHDWSIEGPIDENNPSGKSGGFFPAGVGWYRRHFVLSSALADRRVFIDFDGVMANSDVWINGYHLGNRPYGYISFRYELTGHLNFGGAENVLAVRCDNSKQPASRWYSGAGIYRHVRLVAEEPVHLDRYEPFITTPTIKGDLAIVHVQSRVVNQSSAARRVRVMTMVFAPDGTPEAGDPGVGLEVPAGGSADFSQDIYVRFPKLWSPDRPNLYRAATQVLDVDKLLDDSVTSFGIREAHFEADTGFWLNGKNIKIYGMALHGDGGAFGTAVPLGVWERRLALLKTLGCNAIRTAHNPPAPEVLDLCDRLGLMVLDEAFDAWTVGKTGLTSSTVLADYHLYFKDWWRQDATDFVERDRNHPSIVIWSAGNEIRDINPNNDLAARNFVPLRDLIHQLDPTRPVTLAVLRPNINHIYDNGFAELMDVVGQNYREGELLAAHEAKPTRKILGTENHMDVQTWLMLRDNKAMSGQFLWNGVDYLGSSPQWPIISSSAGLLDRTGLPKAAAYQRASWWTKTPVVRIARLAPPPPLPPGPALPPGADTGPRPAPIPESDWTSRGGTGHLENVQVYTNCQNVELILNGKSLGTQNRHADDSALTWNVPFAAGELKAVARDGDRVAATQSLRTAGRPARIMLSADQENLSPVFDQVSFIRATVVDSHGVTVPDADNLITFHISGPGFVAAVDNGDPMSHESFRGLERHAFDGHCVAMVKASGRGRIRIEASAADLAGASVEIAGR
jgi:beta-galactosidase